MRLAEAARPAFGRHETFHPRYGWFRKAYTAAASDSDVFSRQDAPAVLGVGKNMVRAIRFWGLAAKLIVDDPGSAHRRTPGLVPTRFGQALFGDCEGSGWDPYMEDPGTLWLLHWRLLAPVSWLPVWWLAFNEFRAVEFGETELERAVTDKVESAAEWTTPHASSIRKDVQALLHAYAPAQRKRRASIDDLLDCPLRELRLIRRSSGSNEYRFAIGAKPTLPPLIAAHAALDFTARTSPDAATVLISRLAQDPGSPGRAFRLTESELLAVLEPAVQTLDGLSLSSVAGATQLSWSGTPKQLSIAALDDYFGTEATDMGGGIEGDWASEAGALTQVAPRRHKKTALAGAAR